MQLSVTHQHFCNCLDYVISAIPPARINNILSHVLIRAKGNDITMVGTNHEIQVTAACQGKTKGEVERLIPADKLRRVLNTFSSESVIKMDFSDKDVQISVDKSKFKLMTQNTDGFVPLGETSELKELVTLTGEEFMESVNKVHYAAAEESHRRSLNGVLFQLGEEGMNFVGTDGHRMAVKTMDKPCADSNSYIVPVKTIQILTKHVGSDNEVKISANDRVICFNSGQFELISNVIGETYPDYMHVIPRNNEHRAVTERAGLKKALERVIALSDDNAIAYLEFDKNKLSINCNNSDNDSLTDLLEVKYESEKMTLVLNAVYLTQFLNVCKDQMIEISMSEPENSVLINQAEDPESLKYVVMPVRT